MKYYNDRFKGPAAAMGKPVLMRPSREDLQDWIRRRGPIGGGAITLTYLRPYGTVTPSQALQSATPQSIVICTVNTTAAGDTSILITHALNLSAAEITQGFPILKFTSQDGLEISSPLFEVSEAPNFTLLGRAGVGAGGTTKVIIDRPATSIR